MNKPAAVIDKSLLQAICEQDAEENSRCDGSGVAFGENCEASRRMATALWSRQIRVGAKSFGMTVQRVNPKVFATEGETESTHSPKKIIEIAY